MIIKARKKGSSTMVSISVDKNNERENKDLAEVIHEMMAAGTPWIDSKRLGGALLTRGYEVVRSTKQTIELSRAARNETTHTMETSAQ